ncbi:copper homeostasis protein CutC [Terriglobus tenax]|uniref:copper homeostasis protein CutC n=1 Tax=Terriglobus tenax TaxID=1111115 RepID=UPI0021E000E1|nr:copper homeostasis protein CutC [Terriglobus tenax]
MQQRPVQLEVAVDSTASLNAALEGGADRIELCSALADGGLTPSIGFIGAALQVSEVPIHVMIRPRAGGFVYTEEELTVMRMDIEGCKEVGAQGVVFGLLTGNNTIDVKHTLEMVERSRPMKVVFHRAFDVSADLEESLEDLIACGVDEVLTSGGDALMEQGMETVTSLVRQAAGRIRLIGGSGVTVRNAKRLWDISGVDCLHGSFRGSAVAGSRISMGDEEREFIRITSREDVARVKQMLTAQPLNAV